MYRVVLETKVFSFWGRRFLNHVVLLFHNHILMEKSVILHLNKRFDPLSPRMLCAKYNWNLEKCWYIMWRIAVSLTRNLGSISRYDVFISRYDVIISRQSRCKKLFFNHGYRYMYTCIVGEGGGKVCLVCMVLDELHVLMNRALISIRNKSSPILFDVDRDFYHRPSVW